MATTNTQLVVNELAAVYIDGTLHEAGATITVPAAEAASLLEEGVARDAAAPAPDSDREVSDDD